MSNRSWKKAGVILLSIILLLGVLTFLLYQNRQRFIPKIEKVPYLQVELTKDSAVVQAGIQIKNQARFAFRIDSIHYQVIHNEVKLGWGKQLEPQTLPALAKKVIDFRLFLATALYRKHLAAHPNHDSLDLKLRMQLYIKPPFLKQQVILVERNFKTAIPKSPALKIDTFFVKKFSPEAGYTFQLNLNTGNTNLPDLKIEDLHYSIRLTDSIVINGKLDSAFRIKNGEPVLEVPIHLNTAELIELVRLQLRKKTLWNYDAKVTATLKIGNKLFENTTVSLEKSGALDTRKFSSKGVQMPTVKQIRNLQLVAKEKNTFLEAELLIHNPTKLPLYIDSARYFVRYKGEMVANGGNNLEKVLPAKGDQLLQLPLTVNNQQYRQLMAQPQEKNKIPLEVELVLHYNLPGSKPQQIPVRKKITVPVTESPTFEFADIKIKQLDPQKGAQLLVKLKVKQSGNRRLQLDDLDYHLLLKNSIDITGKTQKPIMIEPGTQEIEIPVNLSGKHVNLLAKGLIQGVENWDYTLSGSATVSTPNSLLHQTNVVLQTSGVYSINSKGTPDFMPELSKIDTLNIAIHYDTAWVHMYAAIYNTLPATIHISLLQVDVIHETDTIGKTEEKLSLDLAPDTNTFAWHTLGIKYGLWEEHVKRSQTKDSMYLNLPSTLFFDLGNLGKQQVILDWSTKIPTPATPVTLLQRLKLRGVSFREGLKFEALIAVQNANSEGLTIKNIDYKIMLENGVDICGKLNRTYKIPVGLSELQAPINLSVWEGLKLLKRQLLGPPLIDYKIKATATVSTSNPKLKDVFVIFENWNQSNLREEKTLKGN